MNERQKILSLLSLGVSTMYGLYWLYDLFLAGLLPFSEELRDLIGLLLIYVIGYGLFLAITRRSRTSRLSFHQRSGQFSGRKVFLCIMLQFTALSAFLVLTLTKSFLTSLLGAPLPEEVPVSMTPLGTITVFLLAPVMEELVFRRAFAEALLPHGERFYVYGSAFSFAILHMVSFAGRGAPLEGLPQTVYTFLLGIIWAHVIVKTGDLGLVILLHILSNVCGQLLPLLSGIAGPLALLYLFLVMGCGLLGVLLLNHDRYRITLDGSTGILHRELSRELFTSVGIWFQISLVIVMILYRAGGG